MSDVIISDRLLPVNSDIEQLLLGALMNNNTLLNQVGDFLLAEHFYEPIHQKLFQAVNNLIEKGLSASVVTVYSSLAQDLQFTELGGKKYLAEIASKAVVVINSVHLAKIIYDLALKRQLINTGEEIVNEAYEATIQTPASTLIEKAENQLFNLAVKGNTTRNFEKISVSIGQSLKTIAKIMKNPGHMNGVTTGFIDLDNILYGFHNSDLVILAARPSMGKTALALNLAMNAATSLYHRNQNDDKVASVGVFSLEMSAEQLATRVLSTYSGIESSVLKSGKLNEAQYNELREKSDEVSRLSLFLDDSSSLTLSAIRTKARRLKRQNNLAILFIDYLQLINSSQKRENRVLEIAEITQGLKALAKELNIPIVVLSQLSRAVESRVDKRPMLSDLRESGAIEQDADIVMFIYREEYYLARNQPPAGSAKYDEWQENVNKVNNLAEIIIAKHRNGAVGNVSLYYSGQFSKFENFRNNYERANV